MQLRYYDPVAGALRIKRRYVWGFWAYLAGMSIGIALVAFVPH